MKNSIAAKKKPAKKSADVAASYNENKMFEGKQYTGMAVGRSHKWYYDQGIWLDKKITPVKWLVSYEVTKRRAGKAPKGSGAPIGTEYHWYILAHQVVKKLDANSYSTALNGLKFKLAHKRSNMDKWSISDKAQREHLIEILKGYIRELENEPNGEFAEKSSHQIKAAKPARKKPASAKKRLKANRS